MGEGKRAISRESRPDSNWLKSSVTLANRHSTQTIYSSSGVVKQPKVKSDARYLDTTTGNRVYTRNYVDGPQHTVVVRADGAVIDQKPFSGKLITQFPTDRGIPKSYVEEWKKSAGGQSQGTSAAASKGS